MSDRNRQIGAPLDEDRGVVPNTMGSSVPSLEARMAVACESHRLGGTEQEALASLLRMGQASTQRVLDK
jgi:hypothetical protein